MKEKTRILIDTSSILWTSIYAGEDKEFGRKVEFNGRKVQVNGAMHGYENAVNMVVSAMKHFDVVPKDLIFVVEGVNGKSLRRLWLPSYKSDESHPPEAYEEFNRAKGMLLNTFLDVGAQSVTQDGVEGDDVLAYLALNLDGKRIIFTNDGDMSVLVNDEIHVWRRDELDVNPYAPFPHKFITLYKALVGDVSDKIPGAKGFGQKAFLDLLCMFNLDGLQSMEDLIKEKRIPELAEDVGELKSLQKIIDGKDGVYASWNCAKLYPERVNTMRSPLKWQAGMVQPLTSTTDERVKDYAGRSRIVHRGNFNDALKFFASKMAETTEIGLDIETSTPIDSDEWLAQVKATSLEDDKLGVDVLGSELTGMGITFGRNNQFTFYMTVDHLEEPDVKNIDAFDVLKLVKRIPEGLKIVVHNNAFEQPILKMTWESDEEWQNNGFHGFLPNVVDTAIMASYVNENEKRGLKDLSKRVLNYRQKTYDETTKWVRLLPVYEDDPASGKPVVVAEGGQEMWLSDLPEAREYEVVKQFKMNELTARHVAGYGSDDPICTVALYNHFVTVMEIEKTLHVHDQVEIDPAYLTAEAFVKGTRFSLERMRELEEEDNKTYDENWAILRNFLIDKGWEGTVCPVFEELTPAAVKEAYFIVSGGQELKTQVRKLDKLADLIESEGEDLLASFIRRNDVESVNTLVRRHFKGEPVLDVASPKQMRSFLYDVLGLPVQIINKLTLKERADNKALADAVAHHNKLWQGSTSVGPLSPEEKELLKLKATTDDDAVNWALTFDADEDTKVLLKALQEVKKVTTRRSLFYKKYRTIRHWKTNRVHPSLNQCAAVTRRYSSSGPNVQQLPKKGEGVKFRECYVPHKPGAIVVSIDFTGQELRLMAGQSLDKNMMACYVGEKLKDPHSITGTGIMVKKWGKEVIDDLFNRYGTDLSGDDRNYDLFIRLRKEPETAKKVGDIRKDGKNVNFAAQFDAMAPKIAVMLTVPVADAQIFLDAKHEMFPRVETWKDEVRAQLSRDGYVTTMMGARRHLAHLVSSPDKWIAERAGRQGPNFKIQGSAGEMTKLGMGRVWKSNVTHDYDMLFIAPIHDELVFSVIPEHALDVIRIIHECMTQPYADLPVPILGSISMGPNFGVQIEVGEVFDPKVFVKEIRHWAANDDNAKWSDFAEGLATVFEGQVLKEAA